LGWVCFHGAHDRVCEGLFVRETKGIIHFVVSLISWSLEIDTTPRLSPEPKIRLYNQIGHKRLKKRRRGEKEKRRRETREKNRAAPQQQNKETHRERKLLYI
jgi:hypothetical protein